MTILLVLIPLGIVLLGLAIALFVWAVRHGQFEDLEGEGARILFDDPPLVSPSSSPASSPSPSPSSSRSLQGSA
jgi:cbb3-type cytochrome oxidase maturation protein